MPARERRRHDRLLIACAVICVICTVATVGVVGPTVLDTHNLSTQNGQRIKDVARLSSENVALTKRVDANADQTSAALCALRRDLEKRVASSTAFLREHPHGIPGISGKTIKDGIANQQRTISALRGLSCK